MFNVVKIFSPSGKAKHVRMTPSLIRKYSNFVLTMEHRRKESGLVVAKKFAKNAPKSPKSPIKRLDSVILEDDKSEGPKTPKVPISPKKMKN